MWQTVYRLLGDQADAVDCFQKTFISALKTAQRQRGRNFKERLIRAIKYSSNICCLEPDEYILVAVKGASNHSSEMFREVNTLNHRFGGISKKSPKEIKANPPAGMTIRIKKSDVDSYIKDELDYEQFCKAVEIIAY